MTVVKRIFISLVLAVCTLLVSIAAGLGIIHLTGFIYDIDLEALDIPGQSGYSKEVCLVNYDYVMEYLSPFNSSEFELPSIEYSFVGADHFADCRVIFSGFYLWGAICFVIMALMLLFLRRDRAVLKLSGILTLALPLFVGLMMLIDFDTAFTLFHKLLFNDQNWIFDPVSDPIITILPAEFFMHCGLFIAAVVVLFAAALFIGGLKKNEEVSDT